MIIAFLSERFFVSLTPTGSHPPICELNLIPRRAPAPVSGPARAHDSGDGKNR
jgi:hypothetical protein